MTTRIIIARHGNTFAKGDVITRVGGRTDLPLVEDERGRGVGRYLRDNDMTPDVVFSGPLKRHIQTTSYAVEEMGIAKEDIKINHDFSEIDYGPDENKPEEDVIARLGQEAIDRWNKDATVPDGWLVDPKGIVKSWHDFADMVAKEYKDKTVLLVSSNGTIRFAPYITGDFEKFSNEFDIKVTTGGVCIFEKEETDENWKCKDWNIKAYKNYR